MSIKGFSINVVNDEALCKYRALWFKVFSSSRYFTSVLRQFGKDLGQITRRLRLILQAGQTSSKAETTIVA